jgi:hypothetical protein
MRLFCCERGSVALFFVLGLLALVGMAALAVDGGYIYVARTQLAGSADAGALAAMQVLREGGSMGEARLAARRVAEANRVVAGGVGLAPVDVVIGDWDFRARTFTPGGMMLAPAVKVTARRDSGSRAGRLPLALASVIGSPEAQVRASAVATSGCREIVLVQDVTISFAEEIDEAREALRGVVDLMADHALPGDKLGLVIFAAERRRLVDLLPMPQARAELLTAIEGIRDCRYGSASQIFPGLHPDSCRGTDQAMGIQEAHEMFLETPSTCGGERLIVVVSDGVPCGTFTRGGHPPGGTEQGVMAAADAAAEDDLSISPIMLWDPYTPEIQCRRPGMGAQAFNASMARGFGRALDTPDEDDLDLLLRSVLSQIPVKLVQ